MLEEDLDDTHLCIKCSATIVGLANYIQHRKTNCAGKASRSTIVAGYSGFEYPDGSGYAKSAVDSSKSSKTLTDPYDLPYELGADVFFSSLQLQSVQASGGKTGSAPQTSTRKAAATTLSSGRDEIEGEWQEETPTNTDNLMKVVRDIGETKKFEPIFKPIAFTHESPEPEQSDDEEEDDDEFDEDDDDDEDYVPHAYSGGKWKPGSQPAPRSGGKWKSRPQATHTGGKWSFKMANTDGGKWKPSHAEGKATPENSSASQNRTKLKAQVDSTQKDRADETMSPEVAFTGGKWKQEYPKPKPIDELSEKESRASPEIPESGGKWKPGFEALEAQAGGKWKPGSAKTLKLIVPPLTGGKWKSTDGPESAEGIETHMGGKWRPGHAGPELEVPTSGGKWKPGDRPGAVPQAWDDQEPWGQVTDTHPPSEHTKGKWVPGTKVERLEYKSEAAPLPQDFWCNICSRKLKNKTIYENHLKSGVHLRKSETEQQLERATVEQLELSQQILRRPPPLLLERPASPEVVPGKRKRLKAFIRCEICKHRMQRYLVGKHLISHYHYARMAVNPAISFRMVLENIHQIVLQSPFQCNPCRFYANTEENFLNHWNSVEHSDRTEGPGKFWCSFCRFECEDNNQMRRHLLGTDHREIINIINRSVPIRISKKVTIKCPKCHQGFRFNMELRQHARRCEVTEAGTASDEYQSRFRCELCPEEVLKSKAALQRHEKFKHNKQRFYCSVCVVEFETADMAVKHRKTKEHRMESIKKLGQPIKKESDVKSRKMLSDDLRCEKCNHVSSTEVEAMLHQITHPEGCNKEPLPDFMPRKCPYCTNAFATKSDLKSHLNEMHPDQKHICPLCGEAFTLAQELSSHRRYKMCIATTSKQQSLVTPKNTTWKCSDCTFSSAYESELIFHRIIHTMGVDALRSSEKLNCPLCEKSFKKDSLRHHLRQHTNERIFQCEICKRSFSRRHNYKEHMQYVHSVGGVKERKGGCLTKESFTCDRCGKNFRTKYSLKLHINTHTERDKKFLCPVEHCQYIGRNRSSLTMHQSTHVLKTEFKCQEKGCKYQGKSVHHLKRHMKTHLEPHKIYKCPECDFIAKIPGHIKRHVRVHTKECPYKCPHCDYSCGLIENLRKHILTTKKHLGKFIYHCDKCDPNHQYKTNYNNEYQAHLAAAHST